MPRTTQTTGTPVALLYVHPLLGLGLAEHVRVSTGVEVVAVPLCDARGVDAALALQPRVVIYEDAPDLDIDDLARRAPRATFIDVSSAVAPAGALVPEQSAAPAVESIVAIVDRAYAVAGS